MGVCVCVCVYRPVFEGCFSEEPLPYSDPTGAAGGGNCRLDSPSQESRLQAQRIRGQDSRGHGHTPQNRPHGHQPPDLPEGYGQSKSFIGFLSRIFFEPNSPGFVKKFLKFRKLLVLSILFSWLGIFYNSNVFST